MQKFSQELPADGIEPTAKAILTRTLFYICNTASRIWTRDLKIRNLLFYPTELMRQNIRREIRTPMIPRALLACTRRGRGFMLPRTRPITLVATDN